MNDPNLTIAPAGVDDLPRISALAGVIWRESYPGIISTEQIEYMLGMMYDIDVLRSDLAQGIRYDIAVVDGVEVGFAGYGPSAEGVVKLHKLYLRKSVQGMGIGSSMLRHVMNEARQVGYREIVLNVNKGNARAIKAYERAGFEIRESVVVDIGGGFVMDDYVMARAL